MSLGILSGDAFGIVKDEAYYRSVDTLRARFPWGAQSDQTQLLQQQTNELLRRASDCKATVPENGVLDRATCAALEWRRQSGDTHLSALIDASCEERGEPPCPVRVFKTPEEVRAEREESATLRPYLWLGAVTAVGAGVAIYVRRRRRKR